MLKTAHNSCAQFAEFGYMHPLVFPSPQSPDKQTHHFQKFPCIPLGFGVFVPQNFSFAHVHVTEPTRLLAHAQ